MNKKTITQFYTEHEGKVSDKWSSYLSEYNRLLDTYRDQPVNLLEIGVQNGGSLEIWAKYFRNAVNLIGCDINTDCAKLSYDDPRIKVIIGDAIDVNISSSIFQYSPNFDVIIDDGSHKSGDIIKSFALYFSRLSDGGIYIAEDLCCSYWEQFDGGIFSPYSSIYFFKLLADIVNHEHWGILSKKTDILSDISKKYQFKINEDVIAQVHSVEFINSMCIIRKASELNNCLGTRFIAGREQLITNSHEKFHETLPKHTLSAYYDQSENSWSKVELLLSNAYIKINDYEEQLFKLKQIINEQDKQIAELL